MLTPQRGTLSLPIWALILGCLLYLLAGLIGHDPWKTDDAVHLGVAWEFARDGNWLNPRLVQDPWFVQPPLYHWVAALMGKLLSPALAFHDGARLATAVFAGIMLFALARAALALFGDGALKGAPLLAIGTLGLLVPVHDAQPAIALLAGQALVLAGMARIANRRAVGVAAVAVGIGMSLLSAGLTGLLPSALVTLLMAFHPDQRPRRLFPSLLALVAGLGLAALWPLLLKQQQGSWDAFWHSEIAKLSLQPFSVDNLLDHLELLAWSAWPILPIGLWTLWSMRRQIREYSFALPIVAVLVALGQILVFGEPRPISHLVLIPPLILLAAGGMEKLRRGAANALDWFGMMTFTLVAALIWLGGISMMTGEPARVAKNFTKAEPGFVGTLSWSALIFAGLLSLVWLWTIFRLPRSSWRAIAHWAAGVTLVWSLIAALWMPWLDYGKTYRPVAVSLKQALGETSSCIASRNLGDGQRASLRYFADIVTRSGNGPRTNGCNWLLIQGNARNEAPPEGWRKVWEGNRPGDHSERLRLYRRNAIAINGQL